MRCPSLAIYAFSPAQNLKTRLQNLATNRAYSPREKRNTILLLTITSLIILAGLIGFFGDPTEAPISLQKAKSTFLPPDPYASVMVFTNLTCWVDKKQVCDHPTTFNVEKIGVIYLVDIGLVTFSLQPFADAKPIGTVKGKELILNLSNTPLHLTSQFDILVKAQGKPILVYGKQDIGYEIERLLGLAPEYKNVSYRSTATSFEGDQYTFSISNINWYETLYATRPKPGLTFSRPTIQLENLVIPPPMFLSHTQSINNRSLDTIHTKDHDILSLMGLETYGLFQFSLHPFKNATQSAQVEGNRLRVQTAVGLLQITTSENILLTETGTIWFTLIPSTSYRKDEIHREQAACREQLKEAPTFAEQNCRIGGFRMPVYFERREF